MRPCTLDDFGIGEQIQGENQPFYTAQGRQVSMLKGKMGAMQCTQKPLQLFGDFNSVKSKTANFYFKKCDKTQRKTCKTDSEVALWLKDKYMMFVYNDKKVNVKVEGPDLFDEKLIIKQIPLSQLTSTVRNFQAVLNRHKSNYDRFKSGFESIEYFKLSVDGSIHSVSDQII